MVRNMVMVVVGAGSKEEEEEEEGEGGLGPVFPSTPTITTATTTTITITTTTIASCLMTDDKVVVGGELWELIVLVERVFVWLMSLKRTRNAPPPKQETKHAHLQGQKVRRKDICTYLMCYCRHRWIGQQR